MLEIEEKSLFDRSIDERGRHASAAASTCATDAMHVVLDVLGHVEVDHVLYVGKVEALGGHVGGDEHVLVARLEVVDGPRALLLLLAAVNGHGLDALHQQVLVYGVHVLLLLGEDEHRRRRLLQALQQVRYARLGLDVLDLLDDVGAGRTGATNVHRDRLDEGTLGEVLYLLGHCGREEERLTLRLEVGDDVAHLFLEAHVDHAIGLVEAQIAAHVQVEYLLVEHVDESSRRGHHYVHTSVANKRINIV